MIIRHHRRVRFTVVDNQPIRDERLSWKATGLLVYLLSLPDDWRISTERLARIKTDGIAGVRSAMTELEDAGYVIRQKTQGDRGHWVTITHVSETPDMTVIPVDQPTLDYPKDRQSDVGKPIPSGKTVLRKTEDEERREDISTPQMRRARAWDVLEEFYGYRPVKPESTLWGKLCSLIIADVPGYDIADEIYLRISVYLGLYDTPCTAPALLKNWQFLGSKVAAIDPATRSAAIASVRSRARRSALTESSLRLQKPLSKGAS